MSAYSAHKLNTIASQGVVILIYYCLKTQKNVLSENRARAWPGIIWEF